MYNSLTYITSLLNDLGLSPSLPTKDTYNSEYEGFCFQADGLSFRSRRAKKTPKKQGYFVAFWEKDTNNKNIPFSFEAFPDKLVISVIDGPLSGQFIIPKSVLREKKILKHKGITGKMALRFYPSWENSLNKTAQAAQKWQCDYFIDTTNIIQKEKLAQLYFSSTSINNKKP